MASGVSGVAWGAACSCLSATGCKLKLGCSGLVVEVSASSVVTSAECCAGASTVQVAGAGVAKPDTCCSCCSLPSQQTCDSPAGSKCCCCMLIASLACENITTHSLRKIGMPAELTFLAVYVCTVPTLLGMLHLSSFYQPLSVCKCCDTIQQTLETINQKQKCVQLQAMIQCNGLKCKRLVTADIPHQ